MSATFACPHCGTSYPVKPVLVGRAVRCTKCRNGFVLRENGVADALPMPEASAPAASKPATAATAPKPTPVAAISTRTPAPVAPPAPSSPEAASAKPGTDRQPRLNKQQEEMRRSMAGTLASAAAAVLKATATPEEAAAEAKSKPSLRLAKARSATGRHPKPASSGILVVGAGEQDARITRRFWWWTAVAMLSLVALVMLANLRSAPRRALDDFASPVYGSSSRYPQLLVEMQRRSWISDGQVLVDLGSVRFGSIEHLEVGTAARVLAGLKGKSFMFAYELYADDKAEARIAKLWSAKTHREDNLAHLRSAGIEVAAIEDVREQLAGAGLKPPAVELLMQLLHPTHGSALMDAARIAMGELPASVDLLEFHGRKGTVLRDTGRKYAFIEADYDGRLLKFIGQGWPPNWRVLDLEMSK